MQHYISNSRLNTYKNILKVTDESQCLKAYYWNKALSSAIYPIMQTLEVTLRNALNNSVKEKHDGKYQNEDWWFEHISTDIQNKKIRKMNPRKKSGWVKGDGTRNGWSFSEQQVRKVVKELEKEGRTPIHHDDVISRLPLGYWVTLLTEDYEDVTSKTLLWPNLLTEVFPNTPHKPKRAKIEATFRKIKDLRNRISHHEPIWKFYYMNPDGRLDYRQPIYGLHANLSILQKAYDQILEVIRWMSEERYQSFLDGKLDIEFRKLCSEDGFYGYVDPMKVQTLIPKTKAKREFLSLLETSEAGRVITITDKGKPIHVLGINAPNFD